MKTIIAGSRSITDLETVEKAIAESGFDITEVVSGGANGVDTLGEEWAKANDIDVKIFLADWNHYGKRAGFLRNIEMGDYADALIAVWDGESKGTEHMITYAAVRGIKIYVYDNSERSKNFKRLFAE